MHNDSSSKIIKAKRVADWDGIDYADGKPTTPGQYCLETVQGKESIVIVLPCFHLLVDQGKWQHENAEDETKITMSPSIFCSPSVPCWHGFLRNGEFINA